MPKTKTPAVKKAGVPSSRGRITVAMLTEYLSAEAEAKAASERVKALRTRLQTAMGDETTRVVAKRFAIAWPHLTREVFDAAKYKKDNPNWLLKYGKSQDYRPFTVIDKEEG